MHVNGAISRSLLRIRERDTQKENEKTERKNQREGTRKIQKHTSIDYQKSKKGRPKKIEASEYKMELSLAGTE